MIPRSLRLTALSTILVARPVFGQEDGGLLSIDAGLMFWTILIFLIVLAVLYVAAYPKILGAVEAREARIREMLEAAERDRAEAEELLTARKREMEEIRARAQELVAEGREAGERIREELLEETRREQAAMLERARREISADTERALRQVRDDAVELAIAAASRLLERNLDEEANRRLVSEFLESIEVRPGRPVGVEG